MGGFPSWIDANCFTFVQTVGIIGSLWLTAESARKGAKSKEIENILKLDEQHCALWRDGHQREDLKRVFDEKADLAIPISVAESEFLNLVIVHYQTGWQLAKAKTVFTVATIEADISGFFSLPLPRTVWEKTKQFRNPEFVKFVEQTIKRP